MSTRRRPSREEMTALVEQVEDLARDPKCATCRRFHDLIARLERDCADPLLRRRLTDLKRPPSEVGGPRGCDVCRSGIILVQYETS